jgi:hypothetical protein
VRAAVFGDIHGNVVALDAVIGTAHAEGIKQFWCLGDLVARGPRPVEVVERLRDVEATDAGYTIEYRSARYDVAGVVDDLIRQRHPAAPWLARKMTGKGDR